MRNTYWNEIEIARGIAIIGVVCIHVSSQASISFHVETIYQLIYLFLNKWGHFSVPLFILLSGLVLTNRYIKEWNKEACFSFYKKRSIYVVIPYIFWSIVYEWYHIDLSGESSFSYTALAFKLLTGTANYHLYFIILIIQYYLLFPMIILLLKKYSSSRALLVLLGILVQIIAGIWINHYHWPSDKSWLFTTYFAFFNIGCVLGSDYPRYRLLFKNHVNFTLLLTLVLLILHLFVNEFELIGVKYGGLIVRETIVHIYSICAVCLLLGIGQRMHKDLPLTRLLSFLGKTSFGIYLMHPALVIIIDKYQLLSIESWEYHIVFVEKLVLVIIISSIITLILQRIKGANLMIGK